MQRLFERWIAKRFSVNRHTCLNQSRILIFIFGQGYVFIGLILISFIAGINYANNLILGFCFLIAAILWMSFYVTFKQLHELELELILPEVGQVGQPLKLQLFIKQPVLRLRYLHLEINGDVQVLAIQQLAQTHSIYLWPNKRGRFDLPRFKLYSNYPFGLVRAWSYLFFDSSVWIAPDAADPSQQLQHSSGKKSDQLEEFRELREFVHGDALQSVSWKHLARGQGLMVKVFDDQFEQKQFYIDYAAIPAFNHEQKLRVIMAIIEHCEQQHTAYALRLPLGELAYAASSQQAIQARLLLAQA